MERMYTKKLGLKLSNSRKNEKATKNGGFFFFWLPLLDSNQGPSD